MWKFFVGAVALVVVVFFAWYPKQPEPRREAPTVPGVSLLMPASLPEPTEGTFGVACAGLRRFLVLDRTATPFAEYHAAAIETASRLHEASREPLAVRTEAGLCREGSMVFRFDDGGAMVRHILLVLSRAGLKPEILGLPEDQLRQELLNDFRARIARERVGAEYYGRGCSAQSQWNALMSTIHEAVTRWQFTTTELNLAPTEQEDLASRMGTPRPGSPIPVENCPGRLLRYGDAQPRPTNGRAFSLLFVQNTPPPGLRPSVRPSSRRGLSRGPEGMKATNNKPLLFVSLLRSLARAPAQRRDHPPR